MAKVNQKAEKQLRNEEFAQKHRKVRSVDGADRARQLRLKGGRHANWCRIKGHPPECSCVYSSD